MHKSPAIAACALLAAFAASPAGATEVALATTGAASGYGQWQRFDVSDIDSLLHDLAWIDTANTNDAGFGTPLTFTFTVAAGAIGTLAVVDAGFAGDTFAVTDGAATIGTTSVVAPTEYASAPNAGVDFDAAFADPRFSRGVFSFGAGTYRIGGRLQQSVTLDGLPLNATVGAVRLSVAAAVPEPSTVAALLAGLGVLGLRARRRR